MAKIVISYRRSDSAAIAGRIRDRLAAQFGDQSIFMDIENIPFGEDFRTHIRDTLLHSDVLLAIVGPEWLGHGKGPATRIMNDIDPVRIEIETTLQARIPTIPVLVDGARMPDAADLPDKLKDFAFLNAADVDSGRDFHQHMDRLIEAINGIVARKTGKAPARAGKRAPPVPARSTNWMPIAAALVLLLAGGAGGAYWFMHRAPTSAPMQAAAPAPTTPTPTAATNVPPPTAVAAAPAPVAPPPSASPAPAAPAAAPPPAPATTTASLPAPSAPATPPRCDQLSPVFADDFKSENVRWTRLGETRLGGDAYYEDGKMVLLAALQNTRWIVAPDKRFGDVTICADVKSPPDASDLGLTAGGLIFWSRPGNADDVYSASVYPDGSYAIHRKNDGQWSTIASKRKFASVRPGLDAENQVQLTLKDRRATLYINGVKAQDFDGEPPSGGGVVGLFSRSEREQQNEWRFLKIVVGQ